MCIFKVIAQSANHVDPEKDVRGCYKRGDIVTVLENDSTYALPKPDGSYKHFPKFVMIKVATISVDTARAYLDQWQAIIDYEIVQTNLQVDGARIRFFVAVPGAANEAGLTREYMETWLSGWGATIVSTDTNDIRIEQTIEQIYTSRSFWQTFILEDASGWESLLDTGLVITETNYNLGQGVHTATIDLSASTATLAEVQRKLIERGAVINSIVGDVITAEFERQTTRDVFLSAVNEELDKYVMRRRWAFTEVAVSGAEAQDGFAEVTETVALANIYDKSV